MKYYVCMYCGYHTTNLMKFRYKKKNGYISRKFFTCPSCGNNLQRGSLLNNVNPKQWAYWLYGCIRMNNTVNKRFYDKIEWDKLKVNLKILGIANDFWTAFKEVKEIWDLLSDKEKMEIVYKTMIYKESHIQVKLDNKIIP